MVYSQKPKTLQMASSSSRLGQDQFWCINQAQQLHGCCCLQERQWWYPICSLTSSSIGSSSWKVIVALLALKLSALLNLSFVRFKVDSSTVIETLQTSASPPDFPVYVMSNVDSSLRSLSCWEFCYVPRNLNFLAHNIASWAAFCNWDGHFMDP